MRLNALIGIGLRDLKTTQGLLVQNETGAICKGGTVTVTTGTQ